MTTIQLVSMISGLVAILAVIGGALAALWKIPEIVGTQKEHGEQLKNVVHYEDIFADGKNIYVRCADCMSCRERCYIEREKKMNGFELAHKEVKASIKHINNRLDATDARLKVGDEKREHANRVHTAMYKALAKKLDLDVDIAGLLNGKKNGGTP